MTLTEQNDHDAAQARWQAWLESDEGRAVIAEQRRRARFVRRCKIVAEYAAGAVVAALLLTLAVLAMFTL